MYSIDCLIVIWKVSVMNLVVNQDNLSYIEYYFTDNPLLSLDTLFQFAESKCVEIEFQYGPDGETIPGSSRLIDIPYQDATHMAKEIITALVYGYETFSKDGSGTKFDKLYAVFRSPHKDDEGKTKYRVIAIGPVPKPLDLYGNTWLLK